VFFSEQGKLLVMEYYIIDRSGKVVDVHLQINTERYYCISEIINFVTKKTKKNELEVL